MLIRGYNDVKLGLTTAHWSLTWMNEQLVPAQKGLTQCNLPASEPANVHTAHPGKYSVNFQYIEQYLEVYPFMDRLVFEAPIYVLLQNI